MHALHHPNEIRPDHKWVDWFVDFKAENPRKTVGLEFQEGLWTEKLAIVAILITLAIIVVSIVWVVRGGDLQTVFTVMSFVLTGAAGEHAFCHRDWMRLTPVPAEIALVALYFQVTLSN